MPNNAKRLIHFVNTWLKPTCNWIEPQATKLNNWDSTVLCWKRTKSRNGTKVLSYTDEKTYRKIIFSILSKLNLVDYPKLFTKTIKDERPLLIHSHFGTTGYANMSLADKHNLPHIVSVYGADITTSYYGVNDFWKKRYEILFNSIACVICEGPSMAEKAIALGCSDRKTKVVQIGIDTERLSIRNKWRESKYDSLRILVIGTFRKKKGIPDALKAFTKLLEKHPENDITLTLVGDATSKPGDAEEKERIFNIIQNNNLDNHINLMGFITKNILYDLLYEHDILLAPSNTTERGDAEGGAPVSLIEAAATGCCIVSTEHCDIPWLFNNGEYAYLSPECDVNSLTKSLEFILGHPTEAKRKGIEASNYIRSKHSIKKMIRTIEGIYDEITKNSN